jgi:putative ABC transport system permease protein
MYLDIVVYSGFRPSYDTGKFPQFSFGLRCGKCFPFLGVPPLLGRAISKEDGDPDAPPVFVMNYRLWKREFGGDPKILNTTFTLNGKPTALVGIMPPHFNALDANFWQPMSATQASGALIARLKPGVSVQTAEVDLNLIAHSQHKADPRGIFPEEKIAIVPVTLLDSLIGDFRKTLDALLAAVLLLLLIACTNVANLLLARATVRQKEIAVRATLGTTRGRLIQQLLAESFVLAIAACGAGCLLAYFGLRVVVALIPPGTLPVETVIRIDSPVLMLSLGVTILTTILCGLAPRHSRLYVASCNHASRGLAKFDSVSNLRQVKVRGALVASQIALSIVLLTGAGLLMRSFFVLTRVDLGFAPQNLVYFQLNLPPSYFLRGVTPLQ